MAKKESVPANRGRISAQPRLHQRAREIQTYGTVEHLLPLELEEPVRLEMTEQLNQLRAQTIGDEGTNDLVVSDVLRTNELQQWFINEHLANVPLVIAEDPEAAA